MTAQYKTTIKPLILASKSQGRGQLLRQANVEFEALSADIDEVSIASKLQDHRHKAEEVALALAEAKATKIASQKPQAMVLGSDQILLSPDREILHKAASPEEAEAQIELLAGREHQLISAAVIVENGIAVWRSVQKATLAMHGLTRRYISDYVARHWDDIQYCVGCYRIEAEGRELFDWVEGDEGVIIGMPMSPLLDYLKTRGYEPTI